MIPSPPLPVKRRRPPHVWLTKVTKNVEQFKTDQKKTDDANVVKLQGEVRAAGDAKSEAIRAWAEKTSGKKRSEEQRTADKALDVAERQKAETNALGNLEKGRLALGVSNDFGVVDQIAEEVKQGHDRETIIASLHLNSVQTAILDAYMKPPEPGDDRALSGVHGRRPYAHPDGAAAGDRAGDGEGDSR